MFFYKGKILKVKHGYNPNSSSMGSIIFTLPMSLIAVTFGMSVVSSLILSYFINDHGPESAEKAEEKIEAEE